MLQETLVDETYDEVLELAGDGGARLHVRPGQPADPTRRSGRGT